MAIALGSLLLPPAEFVAIADVDRYAAPSPPPGAAPDHVVPSPDDARPGRHGNSAFVVKVVVAAVVLLGLAGLVTMVVLQHRRDVDRLDAAHAAYAAGDCSLAVAGYDRLLADSRLFDTAGVERASAHDRGECNALLAVDRQVAVDPPGALAGYAAFAETHPDSTLYASVSVHVDQMLERDDASAAATVENCDRLEAFAALGLFSAERMPSVQLWCAEAFEIAGRDTEAYALAVAVLEGDADVDVLADAEAIALRSPSACVDAERLTAMGGVDLGAEELAVFLQGCIATASAADDMAGAADLQIMFLARLAGHPDAPAVEAALTGNLASCDRLEAIWATPAITRRGNFIPTIMFTCAQTAEYLGDFTAAVERYQWFVDHNPDDPRLVTARDGLARSLIGRAQEAGAGELPPPIATGGSGSSLASVVIYNDSPEELRIVLSGPESRIEIMPASATSSEYELVGPESCRTDVPILQLDVQAGDYQVLVESTSGGISPFTGTWNVTSGDAYTSCFFVVTTFG